MFLGSHYFEMKPRNSLVVFHDSLPQPSTSAETFDMFTFQRLQHMLLKVLLERTFATAFFTG